MALRISRLFTLILLALLTGLAFSHVLELGPKMTYDGSLYISLQNTLYANYGPPNVGGFLEPAAILSTVVLAYLGRAHRPSLWYSIAAVAALLLAFPVVFFLFTHPANGVFRSSFPAAIPLDWRHFRDQWEYSHAVRFVLQLAAFVMVTLGILLDPLIPHRRTAPAA